MVTIIKIYYKILPTQQFENDNMNKIYFNDLKENIFLETFKKYLFNIYLSFSENYFVKNELILL